MIEIDVTVKVRATVVEGSLSQESVERRVAAAARDALARSNPTTKAYGDGTRVRFKFGRPRRA